MYALIADWRSPWEGETSLHHPNFPSLSDVLIRSICDPSRLLDLEILTAKHSFDVLCVTETLLTASNPASSSIIPGYQSSIRKDRAETSGGSVAIYVRCGLAAKIMIHPPKLINIEITCVQVILGKKTTINVIVVYRPLAPLMKTSSPNWTCWSTMYKDASRLRCVSPVTWTQRYLTGFQGRPPTKSVFCWNN